MPRADLPIGVREDGSFRSLPLSRALRHQLIVGPTGAGKTGAMVAWALSALRAGVNVVLPDPKGDVAVVLDAFVPAMAAAGTLPIRPEDVISFSAFRGRFMTPQDPLVPIPGLPAGLQAHLVARLIGLVLRDATMGIRMETICCALVELGLDLGLTLRDLRQAIVDDDHRYALAGRVRVAELAQYFAKGAAYDREPVSSKQGVRARFDMLLRVPSLAAALCAGSAVPVRELVVSRLVVCDLGDPPQGSLATSAFVAGLFWQTLVAGIFARPSSAAQRPTLILVDEAPLVLEVGAEEAEKVLSLARSRQISIAFACQSVAQVRKISPTLLDAIRTNVHRMAFFRPSSDDLADVRDLLPVTGAALDPARPDRVLTVEEERRALEARLRRLPERHFVNVDLLSHTIEILRTPDVPFAEARRLAERLPAAQREAFARGRYGVPRPSEAPPPREPPAATSPAREVAVGPARAKARPKLVLP